MKKEVSNKKAIIAIIVVIILLAVLAGVYVYLFKNNKNKNPLDTLENVNKNFERRSIQKI